MALEQPGAEPGGGGGSDACPVCGQPYDHKRPQSVNDPEPEIRADAAVCKTTPVMGERTIYVHLADGEA